MYSHLEALPVDQATSELWLYAKRGRIVHFFSGHHPRGPLLIQIFWRCSIGKIAFFASMGNGIIYPSRPHQS
jgi:hypothetical protein